MKSINKNINKNQNKMFPVGPNINVYDLSLEYEAEKQIQVAWSKLRFHTRTWVSSFHSLETSGRVAV